MMEMKEILERAKCSCDRKEKYRKREALRVIGSILNGNPKLKLHAYCCLICKKWHIGKPYIVADITKKQCKALTAIGNKYSFKVNAFNVCPLRSRVRKCNVCRYWHVIKKNTQFDRTCG